MNNKKNNRKGFTIVELVIVIAVIAILATVLVPTFGNVIENSKQTAIKEEGKNLYTDYVAKSVNGNFDENIVVEIDDNYYVVKSGVVVVGNDGKAVEYDTANDAAKTGLGLAVDATFDLVTDEKTTTADQKVTA